jgi:hypothetical protein
MAETAQHSTTLQASVDHLDDILALAALEQPGHAAGLAALRASGVPMNADEGDGDDPDGGDGDGDQDDDPNRSGGDGDGDQDDDPRIRKANREAAKYRARAKAAEEEAAKLKDKDKSEKQKLEDRAKAAEDRAAKLEHESLQRKAAEKAGLPAKYATRLRGDTEDELVEDAKEMAEEFGSSDDPPPARVRRGPQGRKGGKSGTDMNSLIRRQAGRSR